MARLFGVILPNSKAIFIALMSVYGIGNSTARRICADLDIDINTKTFDITDMQFNDIRNWIVNNDVLVEGDLRKKYHMDIKALISLKNRRGIRHIMKLPVRGQRTHSNARTRKGKVRVAIAGKKKV